ncbi:hypothetical protein QQF64_002690 [Cirrhinus molitorella]|uniref:Uncharacterized protein n=1 Tax=Cirrhinus molitorella TaxID=172907 RepID=A0ABR3MQV4_9TELE
MLSAVWVSDSSVSLKPERFNTHRNARATALRSNVLLFLRTYVPRSSCPPQLSLDRFGADVSPVHSFV